MVKVFDVEINVAEMKARAIPTKSRATAWMELAKKERAAHYKAWGYIQKNKFTQQTHGPQARHQTDWNDNPKKEIKRRRVRDPERLAVIKQMRKDGLTMDAIANELKISEGSVRYWCRHYDIPKG